MEFERRRHGRIQRLLRPRRAGRGAGRRHLPCAGENAALPPQWVVYITVADLDESLRKCVELGGQIVHGPAAYGGQGRFRVFRDPAGAIAALYPPVRKGS
ncbi:MAG: VOC family protein [Thermoanaerobaculia bacterium]